MTFFLALHGGALWSQVRLGFEDSFAVVGKIDPPGINFASGLAFDGDFHPLVVDGYGKVIWRINVFDASVLSTHPLSAGSATTRSLDYDPFTGTYFTSRMVEAGNEALCTVDPLAGTVEQIGVTGGLFNFVDHAIDNHGDIWLITDNGGGQLWSVDRATGQGTLVQSYDGVMGDVTAIAAGPDGELVVASFDGSLYAINPLSSSVSWVGWTTLSGEDYITDFAYDPFSGRWYGIEERRTAEPREWYLRELRRFGPPSFITKLAPRLRFVNPPGGESVSSIYQVRFDAEDMFGGTTIDLFYTADQKVCSATGALCSENTDCPAGEFCHHDVSIGSDAVHPIGQIQKYAPGVSTLSVDWNIDGIPDGRYVLFAKLTPGEGPDGTELAFTRPRAGPYNIGNGTLTLGTCTAGGTACNIDDDCAPGDVCTIPDHAVNITGNKARVEAWTAVCICPVEQTWRINSTLTQPVIDHDDPSQDPYERAITGVPYTSIDDEVTFTINEGPVPFAQGDKFLFTTTGITDVSEAVIIHDGKISGAPIAIINASPSSGLAPLDVTFDGRDSFDPTSEALDFWWIFGDGSPDEHEAVVNHTYYTPGTYTVVLRVLNPVSGRFGEASVDIHVINTSPLAVISASPTSGPAPLSVGFDASGSSDMETPAGRLVYQWDFGDGTTANGAGLPGVLIEVEHTYSERPDGSPCTDEDPCTFTAVLMVTDEQGLQNASELEIVVGGEGACCFPEDICFDAVGCDDCLLIGGVLLGIGLTCDGDPDGDGVYGCDDGCPLDCDKQEPGVCGCGVPDADSDNDSVPDCVDQCPETPVGIPVDQYGCPAWGACCFEVGVCIDGTAADDCMAVEGVHQGVGSTCDQGCRFPGNGDVDGNGFVDLSDFYYWDSCATGPSDGLFLQDDCRPLDLEGDQDVDAADFVQFQRVFLTHTR